MDAPVIEELPISLECKVEEINQYNATLRIVAEIVNVSADENILDGDGFWTETGRLIRRSFMPYLMILQIILI